MLDLQVSVQRLEQQNFKSGTKIITDCLCASCLKYLTLQDINLYLYLFIKIWKNTVQEHIMNTEPNNSKNCYFAQLNLK